MDKIQVVNTKRLYKINTKRLYNVVLEKLRVSNEIKFYIKDRKLITTIDNCISIYDIPKKYRDIESGYIIATKIYIDSLSNKFGGKISIPENLFVEVLAFEMLEHENIKTNKLSILKKIKKYTYDILYNVVKIATERKSN